MTLHAGHKAGLIGANGAGKSSLFALLRGELSADAGDCLIPADWRIAHMRQEIDAVERHGTQGKDILATLSGSPSKILQQGDLIRAVYPFSPIADAKATSQTLLALTVEARADVDRILEATTACGGRADPNPGQDQGFMFSRSVEDPDGHVWEIFWMDPAAVPGDSSTVDA